MTVLFTVCAAVGSTVMVVQFVLMMIGLSGEAFDADVSADFDADMDVDFDADVDADIDPDAHGHVGSSWLFGVISLRTVVAALAFFGLTGLAAESAGIAPLQTLGMAVLAGLAAMYGVYYMISSLRKLRSEGTVHVRRSVGNHGTVYTSIPAEESGTGKIQLSLQNRTMEYLAQTSGHALSPGAKVVVTDVITSNTVRVEPVMETERTDNV